MSVGVQAPAWPVAGTVDAMEAVPPPEERADEVAAAASRFTASQAPFGGWKALRNLIWGTPEFLRCGLPRW